MKQIHCSIYLAVLLSLVIPAFCAGQFGIFNNNNKDNLDQRHTSNNNIPDMDAISQEDMKQYMMVAAKLQAVAPTITSQDAIDLAAFLDAIIQDPETQQMVTNLKKADNRQASLDKFSDSMTQKEIVENLQKTINEFKALEYLFELDPIRAVHEMEKDGMIPTKHVKHYKQNPEQLADDTRKGLYFSFVSLAVAGGFL